MKNALVYMMFLFLVAGMLAGCTEVTPEEVVEEPVDSAVEATLTIEEEAEEEDIEEETVVEEEPAPVIEEVEEEAAATVYADGSYTASGNYVTPAGEHTLTVTLSVSEDVITGVRVSSNGAHETSKQYTAKFADGIASLANGQLLSELGNVSAVNGSSLTGAGFNTALASIKSQAAN